MATERTFGRYSLLERLAIGGMAEIHLARARGEAGFEKTCVIKRVLPHLAANEKFVTMFLNEARLVARLQHPGIAQIFDLGRQDDDYFIAMEYLAGEDLSRVGKRLAERGQSMPLEVAVALVQAAAAALHHAHELARIVHRDVTPSNLMLTYQGSVKVLDFGIALALGGGDETLTGQVKGKASYMSPEQARGERVDRRTDVWALGACLYEFLTGARAFESDSVPATLREVCEKPWPSASSLRPGLPPALDEVLERAMHRDLGHRFPTAEAFREALESIAPHPATPSQLQAFLLDLFGKERAANILARSHLPAPAQPAEGTAELFGLASEQTVVAGLTGTLHQALGSKKSSKPWRTFVGVALFGVLLVGVATWVTQRETTSAQELPLPAPSPREAPAAVPLTPVVAPPEPSPVPAPALKRPEKAAVSSGFLAIVSELPAKVFVDGVAKGMTPLPKLSLPVGTHVIKLTHAGLGLTRMARVTVMARQTVEYRASFARTELHVASQPWAKVFLDDVPVGETPLAGYPIWEGRHRVRLVSERGEKSLTVKAVAGKPLVVSEVFK